MKRALLAMLILTAVTSASAQNSVFGKNKVQYKNFEWQYIQSDHFDVYFAQNGYELAQFAAHAAEAAYDSIRALFRYEITNRVSLVIYNSHNEFQQTNVVSIYLEEGIGGVTELFKNRVVVPFEGSYAQFRHVIHHELVHAVMNDMFYGGTIQSLISSRAPVQLPMWMSEGLAEYSSLKWDTNSDMFIRDATVHNYLPPIEYLGGYFAYRGGQSVFYYIANKYGEQKIAELLGRIKSMRSVDQGFRASLGLSVKELSERWQKEQKVYYWPDVAKREDPADFAYKRLTNHVKESNFYNTSPTLSPQGDRIAFISDRDDYFDVYIMSAVDGEIVDKVVSGQKTADFEELKLLTPGITWSPDGKRIALAVKAGERDAVMIVDVEDGDSEKLTFDLDGIYSVDWSADGNQLAFVGVRMPQSDIYVYNLKDRSLKNVTSDIFSDGDPTFAPDGKTIYFTSDRLQYVSSDMLPPDFRMSDFDMGPNDLYAVDVATGRITRLTDAPMSDESSPVPSPDGKQVLFISDRNGINNMYVLTLESGTIVPITNSISGVYQLSTSRDGSKVAFASLNEAGFDIFLLLRPFERRLSVTELEPTEYVKRLLSLPVAEKPREIYTAASAESTAVQSDIIIVADTTIAESHDRSTRRGDYTRYVFSPEAMRDTNDAVPPIAQVELVNTRDADGNYVPRKYKLNFTPDLVYGTASYNTFFGLEGTTLMAFSDMLGDHQIIFQTNLLLDLKNSDYALSYFYLPGRIDWGFNGFHSARFLFIGDTLYRFRIWGAGAIASYPIDRFNRLDLSVSWLNLTREDLDNPTNAAQDRSFLLPSLTYVRDNSIWQGGWFAPNNGSRFYGTLYGTPKMGSNGLEMLSAIGDYRQYLKVAKDFLFAYRLTAGASIGDNAQRFFIGGTEGWINRIFERGDIPIENAEDFVFLTPVFPLRGYNYNSQNGTHFAAVNMEFRFPLVRYLILGLPIGFQNILGTAFFDAGTAWTDAGKWKAFGIDPDGSTITKDLLMSTGLGTRLIFFGFPLRMDIAWQFRWGGGFSKPIYYFSLGGDF